MFPVILSDSWHNDCSAGGRQHDRKEPAVQSGIPPGTPEARKGSGVSNTESLVVVKLDHNGGQAPLVFEVLEQIGLLDEVSEHGVEMVEPGAVGFRIPRERMDAVVLALECGGFVNVRAYDVQQAERQQGERGEAGHDQGTVAALSKRDQRRS